MYNSHIGGNIFHLLRYSEGNMKNCLAFFLYPTYITIAWKTTPNTNPKSTAYMCMVSIINATPSGF